ncbi:MAG: TolB family protein, partial [Acidimicrobiia bacterium]
MGRMIVRRRWATLAVIMGLLMTPTVAMASQGELVRASAAASGTGANGASTDVLVSGDGRFLVFTSQASNLATGDSNGRPDIFRFDRLSGVITSVSVTVSGAFLQATHGAPVVSADGRFIAFWTDGVFDSTDDTRSADVVVKDMDTGAVQRLSMAPDGSNKIGADRIGSVGSLAISDDGRLGAFKSNATNLVAGDGEDQQPDIYLRDRNTGLTSLLSGEPTGGPGPSGGLEVVISGSGSEAVAGYKVLAADRSHRLMIRLLESGVETQLEGVDSQRSSIWAVEPGGARAIISGGSGSPPSEYDVATKTLTALPDNVDWAEAEPSSFSSDLRYYAVAQTTSFSFHVFDRETETLNELPRNAAGVGPDQDVDSISISDDGSIVAFLSAASNLASNDTDGLTDAFYVRVGIGSFSDDDGNPLEADIEWLFEQGITLGCGIDAFCPKDPVTREQMASFLVRALDL